MIKRNLIELRNAFIGELGGLGATLIFWGIVAGVYNLLEKL